MFEPTDIVKQEEIITITEATVADIATIQQVADEAWPVAFQEILSPHQIAYMMEMMYSYESLQAQLAQEHRFFIARRDNSAVAYMSIEHNCEASGRTKIHKAYILPYIQRQGVGGLLFARAYEEARINGDSAIYLNVNKENERAIAFYYKEGFELIKQEVIDIGSGFVMDDFVFEKKLQ